MSMQPKAKEQPTILVVEPDNGTRRRARHVLERIGLVVHDAKTAEQAISAAVELTPDVALLACRLPSVDGIDTCRDLREAPALVDMPIIMLADPDDAESISRAYEAGATDFMTKPVDWSQLGHKVRYALRMSLVCQRLRNSRLRNRALVQAIPDSMLVVDSEGIPVKHHVGKEGNPLIELWLSRRGSIIDILDQDLAAKWAQHIDRVLDTGESQNCEDEYSLDGCSYYFETRMVPYTRSRVLVILRDVSVQRRADAKVHRLAFYDTLTGLPNRQSFLIQVSDAIREAEQSDGSVAILYIDLDNFKRINDSLGHSTGDELLKRISRRLERSLRREDFVARYGTSNSAVQLARLGGDEFMILLPHVDSRDVITSIANRVTEVLSEPLDYDGQQFVITPSIGIAVYPEDGEDIDTLVKNADMAMYDAKSAGRNCVSEFSGTMSLRSLERLDLEDSLRSAVKCGDLRLHYQPKLDLTSQKVLGVEALVRWTHAARGPVSPAKFIPIAEEAGIIMELSDWVLQSACDQLAEWQAGPLADVKIAINLSAKQFYHEDVDEQIVAALASRGLDHRQLELELTEGTLMRDVSDTIAALSRLKDAGFKIAVDDFGTGYSSLSYLKKFPIDALKIDRTFVAEVAAEGDDRSICRAIIALAHGLQLDVIAEGVETAEQLAHLRALGCDLIQGYYFAAPMSGPDTTRFILEHESAVITELAAAGETSQ